MLSVLIAFAVLLAALAWLFFAGRRDAGTPAPRRRDGVDRAELEEAEREVMEADNEDEVRDWGPGAGKPRPPEML